MEQHPVPQNVTTFQFRLVGDMTLKQFGYLAAGVILAFICYKLPLPFFFSYPLAALAALGGFGLAFVPVEERPMDIWIMAFLKNVYNPTQWVWQHSKPTAPPASAAGTMGKVRETLGLPATPPRAPTPTAPAAPAPKDYPAAPPVAAPGELVGRLFGAGQKPGPQPVAAEAPPSILTTAPAWNFLDWLKGIFKPKVATLPSTGRGVAYKNVFTEEKKTVLPQNWMPTPGTPATAPPPAKGPAEQIKTPEVEALEANLAKLRQELEASKTSQAQILELQKKLSEAASERAKIEMEMEKMKTAKAKPAPTVSRPAGVTQAPSMPGTPTVRVISPESAVKVGLPRLTTFPNIVTGIIKDPLGNLLSGILVTVRDKNDIPLRALKSNKLGQFAASTPLPNGKYFIEIEDPRSNFTFDRVEISVTGAVLPPIEISAKSPRQINRDKLAAEIFGTQKPI